MSYYLGLDSFINMYYGTLGDTSYIEYSRIIVYPYLGTPLLF